RKCENWLCHPKVKSVSATGITLLTTNRLSLADLPEPLQMPAWSQERSELLLEALLPQRGL
ncbi:hypothetical protein, partial [Vibrio alginolyticus]|uniref:hypothetical protein n=1 Tax=Vibrio alginolyticus TaxID=663 RepID=UPI001A8F0E40